MILFCPACGDELEGFDPRHAREWPTHCGEVMVRLREDDPPSTGFKRAAVKQATAQQQPVEYLPSDDPGVMLQRPEPWSEGERDWWRNVIADQINAMIDSRVTHTTEAINLQQLSREMERTD